MGSPKILYMAELGSRKCRGCCDVGWQRLVGAWKKHDKIRCCSKDGESSRIAHAAGNTTALLQHLWNSSMSVP